MAEEWIPPGKKKKNMRHDPASLIIHLSCVSVWYNKSISIILHTKLNFLYIASSMCAAVSYSHKRVHRFNHCSVGAGNSFLFFLVLSKIGLTFGLQRELKLAFFPLLKTITSAKLSLARHITKAASWRLVYWLTRIYVITICWISFDLCGGGCNLITDLREAAPHDIDAAEMNAQHWRGLLEIFVLMTFQPGGRVQKKFIINKTFFLGSFPIGATAPHEPRSLKTNVLHFPPFKPVKEAFISFVCLSWL